MALRNIILKLQTLNQCTRSITVLSNIQLRKFTKDVTGDDTTHFGYETVKEAEKAEKVREVFEHVAKNYDVMNDAMSAGVHRVWKDIFIQRLAPMYGTRLIDVAGGTGDIAFRYIKYIRSLPKYLNKQSAEQSHVTVIDINNAMLEVGQDRAEKLGYQSDALVDVMWLQRDAEDLKLRNDTYSAYTIAFGIRNCTHIDKVLEEAYRVLKPGGRFMCLEFSKVQNEHLQWVYDKYSFQVIPVLGQLIAGEYKPYKYLVESIRKFPDQETFKGMIENAGFRYVTYENLTFGVCCIHSGYKL